MSELFDDDPRAAAPPPRTSRRGRALLITALILVAVIFGLTGFAHFYTDRLWYSSAGYGSVFSKLLWTRIGLFLVFGLLMGGTVAVNIYLAYRFRPLFRPASREQTSLDRYRETITPIRGWVLIGLALVVGVFAGVSAAGHWRTYLLWRNAQDFKSKDAYFHKDIGFYVFHLPWWHFVVDFVMATTVLAIVAALVVHYLFGGIRLQSQHDRFSGPAQAQVSTLLGLFVLAKGVDYYLDRYDLVNQKGSLFTGMNYTADNAVLPSKNILVGVAIICAVLFFLNVWRRTWQLPSMGLALMALSAVLLGMIWPAIVQQFQVKPSEADKESSYITNNIAATREAYDLDDVETVPYSPQTSLSGVMTELISDTRSAPLMDPKLVSQAFEQIQQKRSYYSVPPVLDVDRYDIDGQERALVLGVRELDQDGISDDSHNWSNLHTVYTHGNGIIAAYANQLSKDDKTPGASDSDTTEERVDWAQGIEQDDLAAATGGYEDRVYYGENSPDYSIVGKKSGGNDVELNLPVPGAKDQSTLSTFDGPGDASVGSTFNQLMFAIKFGEPNFLLSGRVNSASKVLFDRDPQKRVEKVAPWLSVDSDAYPAVVDGRIVWILDGYTTTDRYPNSQRESFATMIDDALQVNKTGLQTLPTDEINYMRNAVKATVDAYTGEVTLYQWDESDPMLKAWMGAFPGVVKPKSEMSAELMEHVRYPEDLFKVQRYQYARYHVEDASDWYQNNNRWQVPADPENQGSFQAPYRLFVDDDGTPQYSLTSVYVPYGKNNLASFVSVGSDATRDDYGQLSVLDLAGASDDDDTGNDQQVDGPGLVVNDFQSDDGVKEALFKFTNGNSGAQVTYGNLLTLPLNKQFMYIQPVYVSRSTSTSSYPVLEQVLVKYGGEIGNGRTLEAALRDLFGARGNSGSDGSNSNGGNGNNGNNGNGSNGNGANGGGDQSLQEQLDAKLDRAIRLMKAAQSDLADQDLGAYQAKVDQAQRLIEQVGVLRDRIRDQQADDDSGSKGGKNGKGGKKGQDKGSSPSSAPSTEPSDSLSSTPAGG